MNNSTSVRIHRLLRQLLVGASLLSLPGTAFATTVWNISTNTTLNADHNGPIVITGNNVTLNCNGHTIYNGSHSAPPTCGVANSSTCGVFASGKSYTSVINCKIQDFAYGIELRNTSNSLIANNHLHGNSREGLTLDHETVSDLTRQIRNNTIDENGVNGITSLSSNGPIVYQNDIQFNVKDGIQLDAGQNHYIASNGVLGNGCNGIELNFSGANTVYLNQIESSGSSCSSSGHNGISLDGNSSALISGNSVRTSGEDGIRVQGSTNVTVDGNYTAFNWKYDLHQTGPSNSWTNNTFTKACGIPEYADSCQ